MELFPPSDSVDFYCPAFIIESFVMKIQLKWQEKIFDKSVKTNGKKPATDNMILDFDIDFN